MLSNLAIQVRKLINQITHATLSERVVAARVLADARMLAGLRQRDGTLARRPNRHDAIDTCPYTHFYEDGACPWCRVRSTHRTKQRSSQRLAA